MRPVDRTEIASRCPTGSASARAGRLVATLSYFGISTMMVAAFVGADHRGLSGRAAALYVGYLVGQAGLLIGLARRLYRQHQLAAIRFDIGALVIITTMAALLLGTLMAWRRIATAGMPPAWTLAWWFLSGNLLFSLIPLISVCEAVVAGSNWLRRKMAG